MNSDEKRNRIEQMRRLVNAPITTSSAYGATDMCETYLNAADRETVLGTIQERFPHATGDLDSAQDWFDKLDSLKSHQAYVSAFAGEAGEKAAIAALAARGVDAHGFESLTHEDNDLLGSDGHEYSVKSLKDAASFQREILEHPASDHYVVNSELFHELSQKGDIQHYAEQGISILDGGWDHQEQVELASEKLDAVTGDVTDEIAPDSLHHIPVITGIVTLCNVGVNLYRWNQGEASSEEAVKDIMLNLGRVAAAGAGAAGGAAVGAAVGSAIFPLAGTIIGAGVGSFLGSRATRELVDLVRMKWKWGASLRAFEHFSSRFNDGFTSDHIRRINNRYLHADDIALIYQLEQQRLERFVPMIDTDNPMKPTVSAVLVDEVVRRLTRSITTIERASGLLTDRVFEFCTQWGLLKAPRQRAEAHRATMLMFGAIIAENWPWLLQGDLTEEERHLLDTMVGESKDCPNHPFALKCTKDETLGALVVTTLTEEGKKK